MAPIPCNSSLLAPDYFPAMAVSFMTLPREVRYQIYGYLCDDECGMKLTRHKRENNMKPAYVDTVLNPGAKRSLHWVAFVSRGDPPQDLFALLRTCCQETISLLYAQAVFCFLLGNDEQDYGDWHNHPFFPEQSLQMVQQFHIIMKEDSFKVSPSDIEDILAYFEDGNTLRRLTLEFQFICDADWCGVGCKPWMEAPSAQTAIPKMIAALKSLHHFQILMNDYNPKMEEIIAPFVRQVETTLGVAHSSKRWGFSKRRFADRMAFLEWTWHLRRALDKSS